MNNITGTTVCTGLLHNWNYSQPTEQDELWDFIWLDLESGNKLVVLEGKFYGTYAKAKQAATIAFCKSFVEEMDDIDLYTLKLRSW
jgi:hypothetical protein